MTTVTLTLMTFPSRRLIDLGKSVNYLLSPSIGNCLLFRGLKMEKPDEKGSTMTKINFDNFYPEIQHAPYPGDPNVCASCQKEATRVGEYNEPICETCYKALLEDIKQAMETSKLDALNDRRIFHECGCPTDPRHPGCKRCL